MYTLRVYTNWMKNFLPANCYMKEISVFNAFNIKNFKRKIYKSAIPPADHDSTSSDKNLMIKNVIPYPGGNELNIVSDDSYRMENGDLFYLFIQTKGKIDRSGPEKIRGRNTRIRIASSDLTPGINQVTLFDSKGRYVCEKYILTPQVKKEEELAIHSADSFGTRSKISIEIPFSSRGNKSNISVSVAPVANNSWLTDYDHYTIFGSEYGIQPFLTLEEEKLTDIPSEELDELLSGLNSNWLTWDKILSNDLPVLSYEPEKEEHFIEGLLLAEGQQIGFPGENIVMSVPGKVAQFQYTVTNHEAKFTLPVPLDNNTLEMILQPVDTLRNYRIFIESSFSDKYYTSNVVIDSLAEAAIPNVSKNSLNYQVGKIFGSSYTGDLLFPPAVPKKPRRFYGKPDVELILKDFIKLPTMEEIFFELIPRVRVVKTGKNYEIAFLDYAGNKAYDEPPVLMIDGVIFNDASVIARLDPDAVEKIDVVRGIYHAGNFPFYGLVNVITNSGNFIRLSLPEYASRITYKITEPALSFISPDYSGTEARNNRNPDLRNSLYWNPSVTPGNDGTARIDFWSSDISTDYRVDVMCVSSDGTVSSSYRIIKVR